ncbi:GGDEF domain-containing protein [Candidimonas nitroreducens]|nr:GGDEF domain-containing protein [Candidimonas nitroreducens]
MGWLILDILLIASATFLLALLGFATRLPQGLATLWPDCPVLLGGFILYPRLSRPLSWAVVLLVLAATDYFIAQVPALSALAFNAIDVASMFVGYLVFRQVFGMRIDFGQPLSMLQLCLVAVAAAACEGVLVGVFAPVILGRPVTVEPLEWFAVEFLSCVTLLPIVLSAPEFCQRYWGLWGRRLKITWRDAATASVPLALLIASLLVSVLVGGGGAVAFPVIALSYCALRYSVFVTSLLVALFTVWTTHMAVTGMLPALIGPDDTHGLMSLRLAIASIDLAPLIIASTMIAQSRTLAQWRSMADSDSLTGVLNPRGFYREAEALLRALSRDRKRAAVLMMDIDFFKQINDTYGHIAGDRALAVTAALLRQGLREGDACGRLGGEEFAAILAEVSMGEASDIAERIRVSIEACPIPVEEKDPIRLTVSFGVACADPAAAELFPLLHASDRALYQAKRDGRNRVHAWQAPL